MPKFTLSCYNNIKKKARDKEKYVSRPEATSPKYHQSCETKAVIHQFKISLNSALM
jgi:hypothetical protein